MKYTYVQKWIMDDGKRYLGTQMQKNINNRETTVKCEMHIDRVSEVFREKCIYFDNKRLREKLKAVQNITVLLFCT